MQLTVFLFLCHSSGKVDFLYKDKVDSEEYLLGKRVDSNFERQNLPQKSEYCFFNTHKLILQGIL